METLTTPDRYKSFRGIDSEGNPRRLIAMLRRHIDTPRNSNPFWIKMGELLDRIAAGELINGIRMDNLFFIHSYINNLRDLFEEVEDHQAIQLLEQIERECC